MALLAASPFTAASESKQILSDELSLWHSPASSGHSRLSYSAYEPLRVRATGADYYFRSGSGFAASGIRYGEMKLSRPDGDLLYLPREIETRGLKAVRVFVRKSNPQSKWRISIMQSAFSEAVLVEGDKRARVRRVGAWDEVTIPLSGLAYKKRPANIPAKPTLREPDLLLSWYKPRQGTLFGLRLAMQGAKAGDSLFMDDLSVLRDGPLFSGTIQGYLKPVQAGARVIATTDKGSVSAVVSASGSFSLKLPEGAKKGEIVAETSNQVFSPLQGRFLELGTHVPTLAFNTTSTNNASFPATGNVNASLYDYSHDGARIEPYQHYAVGVAEEKNQLVYAELKANAFGYIDRDRRKENPDNAYRALILGECHHMGVHIAQADNWWNEAEGILSVSEPRPVELISASFHYAPFVNGWPAFQELEPVFKPNMVILPIIDPEVLNMNVEEYVREWLSAVPGHLPTYQFETSPSGATVRKPNDREWLVYRAGMSEEERKSIRKKYHSWEYVQADASKRPDWVKRNLKGVEAGLKEFAAAGKSMKTRVVVLYISDFHLKSNKEENGIRYVPALFLEEMRNMSLRAGVEFVDLSPKIHRVMAGDDTYMQYYRGNGHWTAYGHYRMGKALADYVKSQISVTR